MAQAHEDAKCTFLTTLQELARVGVVTAATPRVRQPLGTAMNASFAYATRAIPVLTAFSSTISLLVFMTSPNSNSTVDYAYLPSELFTKHLTYSILVIKLLLPCTSFIMLAMVNL